MPSLDELGIPTGLPLDIDETTLDVGAPEDVLAAVKTEGRRRRARRHRRNTAIAMLGVALLAAPALALLPGDSDDQVTVASEDETTTTERPSTTVPATTETTAVPTETTIVVAPPETATTIPGTRPTQAPTTTVPPLVCRNSANPDCGPFRWDPAPAPNQPLAASFAAAPSEAVVGETVTFIVDWSDADANAIDGFFSPDGVGLAGPCGAIGQRYGPWTPPAPAGGAGSQTYAHTFTAPGTYTVTVSLWTGDGCNHPYASDMQITTTITVTEASAG